MPYALYSTTTGQIFNVLYQQPTNPVQLSALAAQGLAFASISTGIGPSNSMIDLNTGQPLPTGPAMTHIFRYSYDTGTGMLMGHTSGMVENAKLPTSAAGLIVSGSHIPELVGGQVLTLDTDGLPTKNPDGTYVVNPAPYVASEPTQLDLLVLAATNAGTLPAAAIPAKTLSNMNANFATVGVAAIDISSPAPASLGASIL